MTKVVDARKLTCPQPVMLTMKALDEADEVIIVVDNETARENVYRLGQSRGCEVSVETKEDGIYLTLRKSEAEPAEEEPQPTTSTVVFLGSDIIGRGENRPLGDLLMQSFLHTLRGFTSMPEAIIFMNDGVKLVTEDSPVLGELRQLEKEGVNILACGTCLSRLQLTEKVAVGQVSNMYTLADTMLKAGKVVSL